MSNNASILVVKHNNAYYIDVVCNPDMICKQLKRNDPNWIDAFIERMNDGAVLFDADREQALDTANYFKDEFANKSGSYPEYDILELEI